MKNIIPMKFKHIWMIGILIGCIEPYTPPKTENNPDILVVDGFLDATKKECIVSLSKTKKLGSIEPLSTEIGAIVSLVEKGGNTVVLTDNRNGTYSLSNIPVTLKKEYQINVKTSDQNEYSSDFVELKASPDIDSITWDATLDGISIYATTHDPTNNSKYYKWNFIETWHYISPFFSSVLFQNGTVVRREDDIYNCWQEQKSTSILIGSSNNLAEDIIYKNPINFIPKSSNKYYVRYSILVQQQVLSKEAFNYWNELLKNTENLGTLFDPQPSQVLGNIHNNQNLNDPVLGYFSASFTSEKRIFIRYNEVAYLFPFISINRDCTEDTVLLADLPRFGTTGQLLTNPVGITLIGYGYSNVGCVDCRTKGGTNIKPKYW